MTLYSADKEAFMQRCSRGRAGRGGQPRDGAPRSHRSTGDAALPPPNLSPLLPLPRARGRAGARPPVTHLTLRLSALPNVLECLRFLGRPGPRRAGLRELSSRLQPRQDRGQPETEG